MSLSSKESVIDKPEYTVYVERYQGRVWMHCDIKKWSHNIKKRLKQDWDYVFRLYKTPVYALNEPHGDTKHHKFMVSMGFSLFGPIETREGMRYVYWRS